MRILLSLVLAVALLRAVGGLDTLERAIRGVMEMDAIMEMAARMGR